MTAADARTMTLDGPLHGSDVATETSPPQAGPDQIRAHTDRSWRRGVVLGIAGLALVLAGCGSSGESESQSATRNGNGTSETKEKETVSTAGSSKGLSGTGKGTIQIGDMTHEVTMNRCTAMFGAIGGDGVSVSEPDNVEVYFELPPDDWSDTKSIERLGHTGMVRVEIEDTDLRWVSGSPELEGWKLPDGIKASDAALTERNVTNDGRTMEGRATFVEMNSPSTSPNPVSGTFSFSCPPAG